MNASDRRFALLARWLLEGSRGGPTRARILLLLRVGPMNANQIARRLGLNYRTVRHHLRVLEENGLVARLGEGHGAPYALTEEAEDNWSLLEEVIRGVLEGGE